jgi:hypothetical protein
MPEIFTVLALSTAHVTAEVGTKLDELFDEGVRDVDHWSYWIVGARWGDYGWWIWTGQEDGFNDLPKCLQDCINFARHEHCRYIQFDCDVSPIDQLPTYEW